MLRWSVLALVVGLFSPFSSLAAACSRAAACPFCNPPGQTLANEWVEADFILFGTLANAKPDPTGAFGQGTTDLTIELVIKPHEMTAGKKVMTIPRYVPPSDKKTKHLIF